jgi:hypothetical protein
MKKNNLKNCSRRRKKRLFQSCQYLVLQTKSLLKIIERVIFFSFRVPFFIYPLGVVLGHFWPKIIHLHIFFLAFNLNKWFSHKLSLLVVFFCICDFVVLVQRGVGCRLGTRLFDFLFCCGVCSVHIKRSSSISCRFNQWFEHQRCRSRSMDIVVTLILSYCL